MGFFDDVPARVRDHTRAVICRGHIVQPASTALGDALYAWTREHDGSLGDMSLQVNLHGEFLGTEWDGHPFVVGVFLREVYGLDGDHRRGLTAEELRAMTKEADARLDALDASLRALVAEHGGTISDRKLLFTWGGPLCSAQLVKGVFHEEVPDEDDDLDDDDLDDDDLDEEALLAAEKNKPKYYCSRMGASQDEAPGGVFGHHLAWGIYDNDTPPFELTPELLSSKDAALAEAGVEGARLFVLSRYD